MVQLLYISGTLPCGNQLGIDNTLLKGALTLNRSLFVDLQLHHNKLLRCFTYLTVLCVCHSTSHMLLSFPAPPFQIMGTCFSALVPPGLLLDNLSVQNRRTTSKRRWQMYSASFANSLILLIHSAISDAASGLLQHSAITGLTGKQNPSPVQNGVPFLCFFPPFPTMDAPA